MTITPNQTQNSCRRNGRSGFGLTELITVIAILGILAAIVLPTMGSMADSANERRCQRIAQEFSLLANNAIAAGNEELAAVSNVAQAIQLISDGVYGSEVFADTLFRLPNIAMADRTEAAHHLSIQNGRIVFDPKKRVSCRDRRF